MSDFSEHLVQLQHWLTDTATSNAELSIERRWCTLELEGTTQASLREYFDRSAANAEYATEFTKTAESTVPYAFLQNESDLIYSLHKSMVARHKGRLMHYRDDCSQKSHRTYTALSLGLAKYLGTKEAAKKVS